MPLVIAPINIDLKIRKILADDKLKKHLASLGIMIGSQIRIIENVDGNLILIIKETRIAIDKNIAGKILAA